MKELLKEIQLNNHSIFINGEKIDLHVPTDEDFVLWSTWMNKKEITNFLEHGVFPNTVEEQKRFFHEAQQNKTRILLLIKSKSRRLLGVISLNRIDRVNRRAEIATVMGTSARDAPFAALEARSRILVHAFEVIGLDVISGCLVYPGNKSWLIKNVALGFKPEGILKSRITKYRERLDTLSYSITFEEYQAIKTFRNGEFWPGESQFRVHLRNPTHENRVEEFVLFCEKYRRTFAEF
jgi:RimJ/RimL family protein N-acetyltransferase